MLSVSFDDSVPTGMRTRFLIESSPVGLYMTFNSGREIGWFGILTEAKVLIEQWRTEYNQVRPHSSLGYRPPAPETRIPVILT